MSTLILTAILASMSALGASEPVDDVQTFFKEFREKRRGVEVLEAKFTQENMTLNEIDRIEGRIVYAAPGRFILRYEDPGPLIVYLIDGNRVFFYDEELAQLEIFDLEDDPQTSAIFLGFDDNLERLQAAYTLGLEDAQADSCGAKVLTLAPKVNAEEALFFEKARLQLREADYLPCRIHIVNDEESEVTLVMRDLRINESKEAKRIQLHLPAGVKIIDNDVMTETVGAEGKWIPGPLPIRDLPAPETDEE